MEQMIGFARRLDPGLTDSDSADAIQRLDQWGDRIFAPFGLGPADVAELRARFAAWPRSSRLGSRARAPGGADAQPHRRCKRAWSVPSVPASWPWWARGRALPPGARRAGPSGLSIVCTCWVLVQKQYTASGGAAASTSAVAGSALAWPYSLDQSARVPGRPNRANTSLSNRVMALTRSSARVMTNRPNACAAWVSGSRR
jgi:hypothetical protein